jgi:predicted DNA-binding transcriptional regulator AlpA
MAFRLTPPVFRREVERRLLDVRAVMQLTGLHNRQSVMKRVRAGTLPPPVVSIPRSYSLWDKDEIEEKQ